MEEDRTITITIPVTCTPISEDARARMIDRLTGTAADIVSEYLPENGTVNRDGLIVTVP